MGAKQKKHACWGHKIIYLDIIKQKKKNVVYWTHWKTSKTTVNCLCLSVGQFITNHDLHKGSEEKFEVHQNANYAHSKKLKESLQFLGILGQRFRWFSGEHSYTGNSCLLQK